MSGHSSTRDASSSDASSDVELLEVALATAREAAAFLLGGWRAPAELNLERKKARTDLVTRFDRESERQMRDRLTAATPFRIVGEELGVREARAARVSGEATATWYVDPLDGTTNFVHGHPFFAVSIGLLEDG